MIRRSSYKIPFGQYPSVRIAFLFILGIICGKYSELNYGNSLLIFLSVFVVYLISDWFSGRRISVVWSRVSTTLSILIVIFAGFTIYKVNANRQITEIEKLLQVSEWDQVEVTGIAQNISSTSTGKTRLNIKVSETSLENLPNIEDEYLARVLWEEDFGVSLGDQVQFSGTNIPISEPRNPSVFNYREFLNQQDIFVQIRADSVIQIAENEEVFSWVSVREKALNLIDKNFDKETAPIAKALLLGYKNELEGERKQAFARAGLSHIMAVSGLHVGLIVAPFWLIIPYFWTRKHGTLLGMISLGIILWFYGGVTGFSTPVLRASLMAILLTFGKLYSKNSDSINLMAFAALIILLIDPAQLFEIGFQLSFSAVLIILLVIPVIQSKIPYWIRIKWYGTPIMVIIISLVVQLGLYPLQAYYFGEVSIISPIANALFVPFLGIVVPLSLVGILAASILPVLGYVLNYPSLLFLNLLNDFVNISASFSWAWMKVEKPNELLFIFWTFLVFTIGAWRNPQIKWKLLACTMFFLFAIQVQQIYQRIKPQNLQVLVFDVGQGDASLIQTPNGKNILIDAGIWSPGSNSGEQVLLPYFKANNIQKLDAVFLSHPHADHIGGILSLINEIEIDTIYNSGFQYDSGLHKNYLKSAEEKEIPVKSLHAGDEVKIDPSVLLMVLGPQDGIVNSDPNQQSLVLNLVYGESEFLFTGDAGEDQERRLVENYGDLLDTDFLKVGHHGSKTSSELFFLEEVTPEISVVSVGERNRFRHPHKEAVVRLESTNSVIYYTGRNKALLFESDGRIISKIEWY